MNRPRLIRARRRASRPSPPMPFTNENESAWLEFGAVEMRLRRDAGEVVWSAAMPDTTPALTRAEWAARDLAALEAATDSAVADPYADEEVLLERS